MGGKGCSADSPADSLTAPLRLRGPGAACLLPAVWVLGWAFLSPLV